MWPLRILLVEDDAMIGMFLALTLEQMGHEICAVETTEAAAVAAAERERPDLMIIDAGLSAGDGVTAAETILAARVTPFIFASGNLAGAKARFPNAIMIRKPYNDADLARAIETAMSGAAISHGAVAR